MAPKTTKKDTTPDLTAAYFEATGTKPPPGWKKSDWQLLSAEEKKNINNIMAAGVSLGYNLQELGKYAADQSYEMGNVSVENAQALLSDYSQLKSGAIGVDAIDPNRYGTTAGNIYRQDFAARTGGAANILAADGGGVSGEQYTFDPTQGKIVPVSQARVTTTVGYSVADVQKKMNGGLSGPTLTGPTGVSVTGNAVTGVTGTAPVGLTPEQVQAMIQAALVSQNAQNNQLLANQKAMFAAQEQQRQEDAIALLNKTFESYGLGTLAGKITEFVKAGYSPDTVSLLLQDTPEYKKRFAANEARRKAGMAVLSPAEYLATERAYRQIMNAAGLPKGFYDQQEDFTDLISKDVSPGELQGRVQAASEAVLNADPFYTQALRDMYGMSNGDMIAFVLSPDRSLPLIQQKANAVSFGAAASRQGISGIDVATAERFAGQGVDKQQAESGFAQIATTLPRTDQLGDIYGMDYDQSDALAETFDRSASAAQKRRKLMQLENDSFGGTSGVRSGSLAQGTQGLI